MTTRAAFDRGAKRYDLLVALNPGYHAHLRRAAAALVGCLRGRPEPWRLIDLACGSGASTRALVDAAPPGTQIVGLDASPGMLSQARTKRWPASVTFAEATAGALPVQEWQPGTHHGVLTAYLFRNLTPAERTDALAEIQDLLAPGGSLTVVEYSVRGSLRAQVVWTLVSWLVIIPLGALLDRNVGLYTYLWRSVMEFDTPADFMQHLDDAGFVDIATRSVPGWQRDILHLYMARKPKETP
ncbi:MAG: class I SAM-dependent methyltransferase [Propionibacteriaceae bacterium]|nr:class I SAM-dependent methyltransferase [Propionibacteriaceae bacterium]